MIELTGGTWNLKPDSGCFPRKNPIQIDKNIFFFSTYLVKKKVYDRDSDSLPRKICNCQPRQQTYLKA